MKAFAVLCTLALVLKASVGQAPLPSPTGGSAADIVNQVLASTPSTLPGGAPLPGTVPGANVVEQVLAPVPTTLPPAPATDALATPATTLQPPPPPPPTTLTPIEPPKPIEDHKCETLDDLESIVSEMTRIIDEGGILSDWFPDDISINLNNTIHQAHPKLAKDLQEIAAISSEFDDELDRAVEIAGSRIGMETERIDGDERMMSLMRAVPQLFKDPVVIAKACPIVKLGANTAHNLQKGLYACENALKYGIIPNVDEITQDLEHLSKKVLSIDVNSDDDTELTPILEEIKKQHTIVDKALAADKDIVTKAGLQLTKCVVDLINTAKKDTDKVFDDFKATVPSQTLKDALKVVMPSMPFMPPMPFMASMPSMPPMPVVPSMPNAPLAHFPVDAQAVPATVVPAPAAPAVPTPNQAAAALPTAVPIPVA